MCGRSAKYQKYLDCKIYFEGIRRVRTDGVKIIADQEYYREVLALYKVAIMSKLRVRTSQGNVCTMGMRLKVKGQVGSRHSDRFGSVVTVVCGPVT